MYLAHWLCRFLLTDRLDPSYAKVLTRHNTQIPLVTSPLCVSLVYWTKLNPPLVKVK